MSETSFKIRNLSGGILTFELMPMEPVPEGTPQWRVKRLARSGIHFKMGVGAVVDLMAPPWNLEWENAVNQPNVQSYMNRGWLKHEPDEVETESGEENQEYLPTLEEFVAAGYKAENYETFIQNRSKPSSEEPSNTINSEVEPIVNDGSTETTEEDSDEDADQVGSSQTESISSDPVEKSSEEISNEPEDESNDPSPEADPEELLSIKGIGKAMKAKIQKKYNIDTVSALKAAIADGTVTETSLISLFPPSEG